MKDKSKTKSANKPEKKTSTPPGIPMKIGNTKHLASAFDKYLSLSKTKASTYNTLREKRERYIKAYMQVIKDEITTIAQRVGDNKKIVNSKKQTELEKYQQAQNYLKKLLNNTGYETIAQEDKIPSEKEVQATEKFVTKTLLSKISKMTGKPKNSFGEVLKLSTLYNQM